MTALQIRDAVPGDAQGMHAVIEAAYRGEGGWTTEGHLVDGARITLDELQAYIADPARIVLVAERPVDEGPVEEAPRIVGCCTVHLPSDAPDSPDATDATDATDERHLAEFGLFAVDPRVQSGGIGRSLLEAAQQRLRVRGIDRLMIQVLQSRPELRAWYERRGFEPTGQVLPFPATGLKVAGLGMDVLVAPID